MRVFCIFSTPPERLRFTTPDANGNRSGKPRFKGSHYYKSFTYTQLDNSDITKDEQGLDCINLKKIGLVRLVLHRPIPDGFQVKTGTVIRSADGWHISVTLEDKNVPVTVPEIEPTEENSIGIDLGVENYVALSNGEVVEHPRFFRVSANKLAKLQQRLSKHKKHSKPWKILKGKIAKLHQHIARQRLDWQFKLAYWIFGKCDVLFVEDLKLKNLTRKAKPKISNEGSQLATGREGQPSTQITHETQQITQNTAAPLSQSFTSGEWLPNGQAAKAGLNKSMLDAAHGQEVQVLKFVAWKQGIRC